MADDSEEYSTDDSDLEEYGTIDWYWKYSPVTSAVMFRAGREAERRDVVAWLDGVGTQYMQGDMVPCDEFTGEAYHQAKDEIESCRHVGAADKERGE